ncbi:MAG: hypothetical protein C0432_01095 [Candidatus Puniceispirillum sp.]|nr:hypothetical protein [Candidatus Pelagibacter sp.]MBA4282878.1 hypothetical protein [Candidatus Puniceispirillum sp.]
MVTQLRVQNKHIYIITGLFFLLCFKYFQNNALEKSNENEPFIQIVKVKKKYKEIELVLPTILEPIGTVDVKTRIDGMIKNIRFKEGEKVATGDVLLDLDDDLINSEIKGANAELERFKKQLDKSSKSLSRSQSLLKKKVTTEALNDSAIAEFEDDRFQIKNQESKIKSLEVEKSYHYIKAPRQGQISFENIDKGNYIKTSDNMTIAKIVDIHQLRFFLPIPEKYISYISAIKLENIRVRLFDSKNNKLNVTIEKILTDKILDHKTGVYRLKFILDNRDEHLKTGSIVRAELTMNDTQKYISIPENALNMTNDGSFVYVFSKKDSKVSKVFFKNFNLVNGEIYIHPSEIKLNMGDYVVVSGQVKLNQGQKKFRYEEVKFS